MWCVRAPSAGHVTPFFSFLFFFSFLQETFLPGSSHRWLEISFHRLLLPDRCTATDLRPAQLSSAQLGSARLWRFLSASSRPATWQNSTLQSFRVFFFYMWATVWRKDTEEGGNICSCWIPPEDGRDLLWSSCVPPAQGVLLCSQTSQLRSAATWRIIHIYNLNDVF